MMNVTRPVTFSTCEHCGHPLRTEIEVNNVALFLRGKQRQLFEMIEAAGQRGVERQTLFDRLYDDPDSAPASQNVINVMVAQINPKIAPARIAIINRYSGLFRLARLVA